MTRIRILRAILLLWVCFAGLSLPAFGVEAEPASTTPANRITPPDTTQAPPQTPAAEPSAEKSDMPPDTAPSDAATTPETKPKADVPETESKQSTPINTYVVIQNYKLISAKNGVTSKNLQQTQYVSPTRLKIDDAEDTFIIDFTNKKMTTLKHINKSGTYFTETFDTIEKRVTNRRKNTLASLETKRPGIDRDEYAQMWSGLIEINRTYTVTNDPVDVKIGAYHADRHLVVRATDQWNDNAVIIDAYLTDKYKIPAENARILFLLELAGEHLTTELKGINALPLKLSIVLPDGGKAESVVTKITPVSEHPADTFTIPDNYVRKDTLQNNGLTSPNTDSNGIKRPNREYKYTDDL